MRLRAAGALLSFIAASAAAQAPQAAPPQPSRDSGQTVTPAFEGWYKNADGTFSISFGYYNRNTAEVVDIPIGPNNNVSPGAADQGQPTRLHPRRHWGVFAVKVPANFGDKKVTWTLTLRGKTFAIAGSLRAQWEIDALKGEVGSFNTPPELRFDSAGPAGLGPAGIMGPPLTARVGQPLTLTVFATDDGAAERSIASEGRANSPVALMWFVHQGAGVVTFAAANPSAAPPAGLATTTVTFAQAGTYMLRVRVNDASGVDNAGHQQCCWTNGYVKVTVTP